MSRFKYFIIAVVSLSVLGFLLSNIGLQFHKQRERPGTVDIPAAIYDAAKQRVSSTDAAGISRECAGITCELLDFSFEQDVLFKNNVSKAHCVTYAKVCATLCNRIYRERSIDAEAVPVVGYITVFGINANRLLMALLPSEYERYVVDHDMVEIRSGGKAMFYIDPSEIEFTGVERVYPI